jgi:glucose/arabinose dehydrogenase/PKD repeat protein/fibronectin type 3 domain-containing protein
MNDRRKRLGYRGPTLAGLVLLAGALAGMLALSWAQAATPTFVQGSAKGITSGTTNSLAFNSANTAGNLIVVYVVWSNTRSVNLSDSRGNTYAAVAPARRWGSGNAWRSQVFYAKNIAGGANTVTASFGSSITSFGQIYIHEYSGLDRTNPLDTSAAAAGAASAMNSGSATTSNANDLIFGAGASNDTVTAAGAGFTSRLTDFGNLTEDKNVTSAGSYNATATHNGNRWVMHMVAFKTAAAGDTTAPTVPTGLTATATSSSAINLSWTNSTDNIGVAGYKVFRNGTHVATTTTPSYQDTGLSEATSYSYTVSAFDAAGNESARSSVATATTRDVTAPSVPANVAANAVSSSRIDLSWSASNDNVGVVGYKVFRDGAQIASPTGTSYQDTGLTAGTSYGYRVSAVDAAGNESALASAVSATTPAPDTSPPTASVTAPAAGTVVSGSVNVTATASDNVGVVGVQFLLDGAPLGAEDMTAPYGIAWDTTTASNGVHVLSARARDAAGNTGTSSSSRTVTVSNTAPPPPTGLVAGWAFNENQGQTAGDVAGNGNAADLHGGTWTSGKYGGGLRLNGAGEYLSAPNSPSLNISGSSMTLSMWLNPGGSTVGDQVVLGKFWSATMSSPFYQYGLELDGGTVPDFYVGTPAGLTVGSMGSALPVAQWSHLAVVVDSGQARFYVNGNLRATASLASTITARDSLLYMGADIRPSQYFKGTLDDVRLYNRAETGMEVLNDMNTPLSAPAPDPTAPTVSITSPAEGAVVSGNRTITADATDDVGVGGVQFFVDGTAHGPEDTAAPYAAQWDTRQVANGAHRLTARARDGDGRTTLSSVVNVTVANGDSFQNQVLATGFDLPTNIEFLPDGRMLVVELAGEIKVLPPPYTTPDPTPFLQLTNVGSSGVQQGLFDIVFDPNFASNRHYYVFYTLGIPNVDRLSRFTANANLTGTVPGSEVVLYQDPQTAHAEHHGGALNFGNDGMLYFTTGEHFQATPSRDLNSPRGKVHRIHPDGLAPVDNPFNDGGGPHWDSVWAYGLRNPFRAYYDSPTGRLYIGDVGGNDNSTAEEELNVGARGANYGWPDHEGACPAPCTSPLYTYAHNGANASITGGFVYHGNQFPSSMRGNYFFADYAQHWIKRLVFDANGNVASVNNFEPISGSPTESAGDVVHLTEGPDGALYYVDLGYSDISGTFGVSKIRRIRHLQSNQAPVALASANPSSGPAPLTVNFSSAGSMDPEGQPITYAWDFGDGTSSTASDPVHTYTQPGQYVVRLTVSDGENSSLSTPLTISVGTPPTATINSPADGLVFRAGDVINYSGDATDQEDGTLPASAYTWNIDFLHDNHVHPGTGITGVKGGSFTIPTSGHDFAGNTRYRIKLTVTDSNGLQASKSVTIWPDKVNLPFDTSPSGLSLHIDGVARTAPFVLDTLVGFNHTIEARDQTSGNNNYAFSSWSDGGARSHTITVPGASQSYTATYTLTQPPSGLVGAWGFNEGSGATTADASGNSNTASLVNGPSWVAGKHSNAVSLDGVNDYLPVPNSPSLDVSGNALTLSAWLNPASISGDSVVLGKFWGLTMSSPFYQYGFELDEGTMPDFYVGTAAGPTVGSMGSALLLGQWTHVAVVFNGTQAQFYVNGALVATRPVGASITARGNQLRIGADANTQQFYKGTIDDLRIYKRALTASEVQADLNTGL